MDSFNKWLGNTPAGTAFKVAVGAALGAFGSWVATSDVHPLIIVICAAVVPVLVDYFNGEDPRYGRGSE